MLQFTIDKSEVQKELSGLPGLFQQQSINLLEEIGTYLVSECKLDFEDKSRRKASHGITWKELAESTEIAKARKKHGYKHEKGQAPPRSQIGVDNGQLRNSQTPGYDHTTDGAKSSVTVEYHKGYAKFFDEVRPLIPDNAPDDWVREVNEIAQDWINDMLQGRFD
ncbi:hypothetical protein UFOVP1004_39 [uncultured Caudovirales phage]|uniref:Uncharacterized protein n=1 Tax=uncultured Caudovirales phage TaxID=2100421 RepID=A0A6J5QDZ9_9CAUD|nr:hypothetical protein UFOVP1004_39 [uncultured Caudovirales phage]